MKIIVPTKCPSCNSDLLTINGQIFCVSDGCPAKDAKSVEKFCKTLSIKGFGPATLSKLKVSSPTQLMEFSESDLVNILGQTMGCKLFSELERVRQGVPLGTLLAALSIPSLGIVKCNKIAENFTSLEQLVDAAKRADVGEVSTTKLANWLCNDNNYNTLKSFNLVKEQKQEKLEGSVDICITGSLKDFKSRTLAATYLAGFGFNIKNSVTKTVKYLICEDEKKKSSSSYKAALELDIPILTISELITLTKENK